MPWPLEQMIRQYIGFEGSVIKEYNSIVEYDAFEKCLIDKRTNTRWLIAQWRSSDNLKRNPYVYQFRFLFKKDFIEGVPYIWLEDRISKPRCFYKDIVRSSLLVGRVI